MTVETDADALRTIIGYSYRDADDRRHFDEALDRILAERAQTDGALRQMMTERDMAAKTAQMFEAELAQVKVERDRLESETVSLGEIIQRVPFTQADNTRLREALERIGKEPCERLKLNPDSATCLSPIPGEGTAPDYWCVGMHRPPSPR